MKQLDEALIARLRDVSVRHRVRRHTGTLSALAGVATAVGGRMQKDGRHVYVDSLCNLDLELKAGDRIGLLGSNGSGKTTLLSVLGGLLPPSSGEVLVRGLVVPILNIHSGFNPMLTGRENVALKALYLNMNKVERQQAIEDVLAFSGIGSYFDIPIKNYSAGMRVRLALVTATLQKPDLLLMDEWINAGDDEFRAKSQQRLETLVSDSGAMVLASHAYPVLKEWVSEVIWLRKGEIIDKGPITNVWKAYRKWQINNKDAENGD